MKKFAAILVVLAMVSVASAEVSMSVSDETVQDFKVITVSFTASEGVVAGFDGSLTACDGSPFYQVWNFNGFAPTPLAQDALGGAADPLDTHFLLNGVLKDDAWPLDEDNDQSIDSSTGYGTSLEALFGLSLSDQAATVDLIQVVLPADGAVGDVMISDTILDGPCFMIDAGISDAGGSTLNVNSYVGYVPEPATMTLLGLGGLALIRRRR
jgi:hypothetical protein